MNVAGYFIDPDGDALTYTATSSNAATAAVAVSGSLVTVTATAQGVVTVTVTATDPGGFSAQQSFEVTVPNQAPVAMGTLPAQTVIVGETAQVDMATYFDDPDGDPLTYSAASSNGTMVSASVAGSVVAISAVAPGTAIITVTATDSGGLSAQQSFEVTVPNRAPVAMGTVPAQTVIVGETAQVDMATYFDDPDGDPLTYAAASSNGTVVAASVAGSVVSISALAAGTAAIITVTATDPGGLSAQQSFEVTVPNQAPVVRDSIRSETLGGDETLSWSGPDLFRDPDGDSLTYAAASSNLQVVRPWVTGADLLIQAVSPGTSTVTFSAYDPEGLSARIEFDVTVLGPVAISGTDPAVLLEAATATVFGSGFSATAAQNQVSIGGLAARVTAATETALSIEVPRADCLPPRRAELRVTVGEWSDARTVGVTPRSQEDLELPQGSYWYTYAGDGCVHLPGSASRGEYLIGVVSVSEDPASLTGVTLTGMPGDATVVGAEGARVVVAAALGTEEHKRAVAEFSGGPFRQVSSVQSANGFEEFLLADDTLRMRRALAHNEIMARNDALLRRLGRATPPAVADARRELQVGDTLTLFADFHNTCTNSGQVSAVVRLVGNSSIWLDDRDNPAETFTDSELADLDAFYAANVEGVHDEYFGGLSDVDGNGRFLVLMTKEVNREGVGGWVWPADLYPTQRCATSNQAEVFYGQVPDPNGSVGDAVTKQAALDYYPTVLTHEVTHLVQANGWVFGNAGYTSWKSEGGATLAEQLVAYRLFGHDSGQELGWSAYSASDDSRYWYWNAWVADMAAFWGWDWRGTGNARIFGAPEECSWVGGEDEGNSGPCLGDSVYGVPSMVLRYALDRWGADYPGGERAMMRRLTRSPARGFASLVDVSPDQAWRMEHILSDFYIALWLDLQGGQAYGMTTWNLQDIFGNLRSNARLQPHTSSSISPRLTGRRVRAGSALYFHWTPTGALSPTSIKVTSPGGGPVPDHISVWALRVR